MDYRFSSQEEGRLLILVFGGAISPEEEAQAIRDVVADPELKLDAKILVDRTRARMTMTPEHVSPQIDLIRQNASKLGKPKVAIVVPGHPGSYV